MDSRSHALKPSEAAGGEKTSSIVKTPNQPGFVNAHTIATRLSRRGRWLPANEDVLIKFRTALAEQVKKQGVIELQPPVQDLATLVTTTPVLRMYLTQAIDQAMAAGHDPSYRTIDELMARINAVMTYAPAFDETEHVGVPLTALLDPLMETPAGFALFRFPELNTQLKAVLNYWCTFLSAPASRGYLNTDSPTGWFCPAAYQATDLGEFQYDETKPYWGFFSWNDFFTRIFKPGKRPVIDPTNPKVIVNACEATPYDIHPDGVQLTDSFWIKGQPYSLQDIFTADHQELAHQFVGGSLYQGFLSALNYHRWHAPVSGTITDAYLVEGTYYSDLEPEAEEPAPSAFFHSQGYMTAVATRAIIVIDCDDQAVGKVACVFVGMVEVSSCRIQIAVGQRVNKGDDIGHFQFGGSSHCLIFRRGVIQSFVPEPPFTLQPVNSRLATAN